MVKTPPQCRRPGSNPWVQSLGLEDSLEKKMAHTPVFLLGEVHGQRSLVGWDSLWSCKESGTTERLTHNFSYSLILSSSYFKTY